MYVAEACSSDEKNVSALVFLSVNQIPDDKYPSFIIYCHSVNFRLKFLHFVRLFVALIIENLVSVWKKFYDIIKHRPFFY